MSVQLNTAQLSDIPTTSSSVARTAGPSLPEAAPEPKLAAPAGDTVKLSFGARAHQLKSQGQTVSQIAKALGSDLKSMDAFFGVQAAALPVAAPVAVKVPAPAAPTAAPKP